jgi:hypothetical protein
MAFCLYGFMLSFLNLTVIYCIGCMGRKKITIRIDEELNERLRKFIVSKYGYRWGVLSKVIEEAIKTYLDIKEREQSTKD